MYNVGGNIVSKTEYAYTTGNVGTATKVYNYTYGNAWKDQLTSFDGTAITYALVPHSFTIELSKRMNSLPQFKV